jgi:hypothetical protein
MPNFRICPANEFETVISRGTPTRLARSTTVFTMFVKRFVVLRIVGLCT